MTDMKKIFVLTAFLVSVVALSAQRGMLDNAIGARVGLGSGATFQHFFTDQKVFEIMAFQQYGAINLAALGEMHQQIADIHGLKWYIGAGGHAGVYTKRSQFFEDPSQQAVLALGVDALIGLEYYFRSLPVQISVDWKPARNLHGLHNTEWDGGGISVRYRF